MSVRCALCEDDATNNCRRCEGPLCAMHKPWKPELACITCEEEWERGRTKRTLILLPITLAALGVGMGLDGLFVWATEHFRVAPGGWGFVLLFFAVPIMIALAVVRWVTKQTFRRRFFAHKPGRVPRAEVVK